LYEDVTKAGFDVVLLEARHVKAALSAMIIKTDRKDAPVESTHLHRSSRSRRAPIHPVVGRDSARRLKPAYTRHVIGVKVFA
jgi:transposase